MVSTPNGVQDNFLAPGWAAGNKTKPQTSFRLKDKTHISRAVNSPALFIPRGFGESGNAIFSFLGEWGIESHSSGNRVGESGNWGIKIFKLIHYKHNFKLDFLVLCME